jgi:hypothetical protein
LKKLLAVASVAMLLSGCGETTEQICRKTDQLMRKSEGQGFVDVGWIGCLKQSPSEARLSYEGIKLQLEKEKGIKELPLMSHDEMTKFITSQPPFDVLYKLGNPDSASYYPFDSNGSFIKESKTVAGMTTESPVNIFYGKSSNVTSKYDDPKVLEDIQGKLAIKKDGLYLIQYHSPSLTYWFYGLQDKFTSISFEIKNGQVSPSTSYQSHFWDKWFN